MQYRRLVLAILAVGILSAACATPGSSAEPSVDPITETQAVQLVLDQDPRFAGIGPADPDLIGQAAWYEVVTTQDGWQVSIHMGWGDCPAGCINEHRWLYAVTSAGEVSLLREEGDEPPPAAGIRGVALAGPTCPVVTDPPDPACADRPVEGAVILVLDEDGAEVARATSAVDGTFTVALAPGSYRLVPQPVDGLMGTAAEQEATVAAGEALGEVTIAYDTGIR